MNDHAGMQIMKDATLVQEGFGITLDRHALKTPSKNPLVLPTKALALAVAAEWRWQVSDQARSALLFALDSAFSTEDGPGTEALMASMQINNRLQPSTMPLMSLAATAIDQACFHSHLPACLVSYLNAEPIDASAAQTSRRCH